MIPAWLQRVIGDVHRAAGLRTCQKCKAPILTGLDADMCALTARADPISIDALGETIALLAGRRTFDLVTANGRKELNGREEWHISAPRRYPVLPEHRCGQPLNAHALHIPAAKKYVSPDVPPY